MNDELEENYQAQGEIIIELAKRLFEQLIGISPSWQVGYYRFERQPSVYAGNASYVDATGVWLVPSLESAFLREMNEMADELFTVIGKPSGVLLLTGKCDFDYQAQFEWENLDRWRITKLDGASGIPAGEPDPR